MCGCNRKLTEWCMPGRNSIGRECWYVWTYTYLVQHLINSRPYWIPTNVRTTIIYRKVNLYAVNCSYAVFSVSADQTLSYSFQTIYHVSFLQPFMTSHDFMSVLPNLYYKSQTPNTKYEPFTNEAYTLAFFIFIDIKFTTLKKVNKYGSAFCI